MRNLIVSTVAALSISHIASPVWGVEGVCGVSDELDFSGPVNLPFGGEHIGLIISQGDIVNTNVDIQFTATGTFDAADIAVGFQIVDGQSAVGVGFSGAQLGWSGQGTFSHTFDTDLLNGTLYAWGEPWSTFLVNFSNLNVDNGPITGTFDTLIYRIDWSACPVGDVDHDMNVNVDDLIAVIMNWGACPAKPESCDADTNGDAAVNVDDLVNVITHWAQWCPKCS